MKARSERRRCRANATVGDEEEEDEACQALVDRLHEVCVELGNRFSLNLSHLRPPITAARLDPPEDDRTFDAAVARSATGDRSLGAALFARGWTPRDGRLALTLRQSPGQRPQGESQSNPDEARKWMVCKALIDALKRWFEAHTGYTQKQKE